METQIKGLGARNDEGNVRIRTGTERRKKIKIERTPLEQWPTDLVKVRTINHSEPSYLIWWTG